MLLPGLFFPESEAVLLRVFSLPRPSLAAQRISVSPSSFLPYIFSLISSLVPSLAPPLDTLPFFQKAALLQPIRCGRIERICKGRVPSGTRGIHPICRCLVSVVLDASLKERVMASPSFIKSLEDLSEPAGDNPGFQFQKKCGCCVKATLSSEFFPFTQGVKGLFSKVFSKDAEPNPNQQNPAWIQKHQEISEAFADAIEDRYTYCPKCEKYVCEKCWNNVRDMCLNCCAGYARSAYDDPYFGTKKEEQKCAKCGTSVAGAKFCPKCGAKVIPKGEFAPSVPTRFPMTLSFAPNAGIR